MATGKLAQGWSVQRAANVIDSGKNVIFNLERKWLQRHNLCTKIGAGVPKKPTLETICSICSKDHQMFQIAMSAQNIKTMTFA